jgi:hypothetical protein
MFLLYKYFQVLPPKNVLHYKMAGFNKIVSNSNDISNINYIFMKSTYHK